MRKTFVYAVTDGAVVVQRGKHLFHFVQNVLNAHHVQEGFLLTGKRGVGQVFGRCRRTYGKGSLRIARTENGELISNGFFEVGRKRLGLHHLANFSTHHRQSSNVFHIQGI